MSVKDSLFFKAPCCPDRVPAQERKASRLAGVEQGAKAFSRKRWLLRAGFSVGAAFFAVGMLADFAYPYNLVIFLAAYLLAGGEVLFRAVKNISGGQVFDENFLMSVATIGAFAVGEYPEGVAVMLFYQVGEAFQEIAVSRSRKSISALMDIRPDFANLKIGSDVRRVTPDEVAVGDCIVVGPGEKVPLDGVVVEGRSALDTSALTGEALPKDVAPGCGALSGSINKNGLLTIEVSRKFGESTVSKILDLVRNAADRKSATEHFITKFARYYTPAVVFAAFALAFVPPLLAPGAQFADWINRALVFLMASCPCALVISIPFTFFAGIGGASGSGILIKGGNYLEALTNVDTVVFDKTGTLTKGVFTVTRAEALNGWTKDELLCFAAHAESHSTHPIALSIQKAWEGEIDAQKIADYEEIAGQGVRVRINGKTALAGSGGLLDADAVARPDVDALGTVVYLAADGICAGYIVISDEVRADSRQAIRDIESLGVRRIVMLTGDSRSVGETTARELGIDAVYSELLPHQKVERLELLAKSKIGRGKVVFVGDGINDAPVLASSDVGVAMGGVGSDAAIEAADVVLMTDEPSKLVSAVRIAKKTRSVVRQNIVFALCVKAVVLALGAMGIATMWAAMFGDVGVSVLAVCNAMRAFPRGVFLTRRGAQSPKLLTSCLTPRAIFHNRDNTRAPTA